MVKKYDNYFKIIFIHVTAWLLFFFFLSLFVLLNFFSLYLLKMYMYRTVAIAKPQISESETSFNMALAAFLFYPKLTEVGEREELKWCFTFFRPQWFFWFLFERKEKKTHTLCT